MSRTKLPPPDVSGLTRREREVLAAVGLRLSNQEIADRYGVSKRTVETHISAIYRKLGIGSRRALVALAPSGAAPEPSAAPATPAASIGQHRSSTPAWVDYSIRQNDRQVVNTTEQVRRATAQIEANLARIALRRTVPIGRPRSRTEAAQNAFDRAVQRERAAIAMHEAAGRNLDRLAHDLEAAAQHDKDAHVREGALDVVANARRRAESARQRAQDARERLRADGVEV